MAGAHLDKGYELDSLLRRGELCNSFLFLVCFLEMQFAEVRVEGEVFDFTFFQVFLVVWLALLENVYLGGGTSKGMQ